MKWIMRHGAHKLILHDSSVMDTHKVGEILESLLSRTSEVVKPLGVIAPSAYVSQLESAFGIVEDGEELFTAFLESNQSSGEKPSAFLSHLHSLLTTVNFRGGASASNEKELFLKQFIRGCWDQSLIIGLQLEKRKSSPPSFPDFLLMLRTEEDCRSAKLNRMKKYLGTTKAAAHAQSVFGMPVSDQVPVASLISSGKETVNLKNKINELVKQVERLSQKPMNTTPISDQGRDFESKIVKQLYALIGASKIRTTSYHP